MSQTSQFVFFLVAVILIAICAVINWSAKVWTAALLASGLAVFIAVFCINAGKAM